MFGYNIETVSIRNQNFYFLIIQDKMLSSVKCYSNLMDANTEAEEYIRYNPLEKNSNLVVPFNIINVYLEAAYYNGGHLFSKLNNHQMYITCK